jgi:type II secretory pathway component GspD/PulD (secretin)
MMTTLLKFSVLRRGLLAGVFVSLGCGLLFAQESTNEDTPTFDPIERARKAVAQNNGRVDDGSGLFESRGRTAFQVTEGESDSGFDGALSNDFNGGGDGETISLNVDDQEIRVILRNIAELFELNIVIPDDLQGRTSLNLRDVTWQQVFDIVLEEKGYSWSVVNGIIRIRKGGQTEAVEDPRVIVLDNGNLRVEFQNTPVSTILSLIARNLELNVVIPPDEALSNELDLRLSGVSWEQIYTVTLAQFGYGYIDQNGIVLVRSLDQINGVPDVSRVFQIKYSEADAISTLLEEQSGVTRVVTDTRSNVVIVTGNPSRFAEIKALIETLDRPTPQVMIESRFVEVGNLDTSRIGVDWASLFSTDGYRLSGEYSSQTDRQRNRTNSLDDQSTNNFQSTINRTGTPPVSDNTTLIESTINQVRGLIDSTVSNRSDTAIFSAPAFNIVLRALKQLDDSKIVSNPTVLALNGQEAEIKIVDHYYYQKPGTVSGDGRVVPGEVERLDPLPGIELKVTPNISGGDFISLKVVPQVNDRIGTQSFSTGEIPIVRQRTTLTHVMVKDRETLAIGGLIDENTRMATSKIPLLGSIPGVGRLFRYDQKETRTTNQIIFITASILNPNETNYIDVVGIDRLNNLGLTDRDVMGARYPLSPEEQALNEAIMQYRRQKAKTEREENLQVQLEAYRRLEEKRAEEALKDLEASGNISLDSGSESDDASAMDMLKDPDSRRVVPVF